MSITLYFRIFIIYLVDGNSCDSLVSAMDYHLVNRVMVDAVANMMALLKTLN